MAGIVLIWAILTLPLIGHIQEFKWEEGRHFFAAQSILRSGNFFSYTVQGERFIIRPPFYIWVVTVFAKLFGSLNSISLRLPSALSSLIMGLSIYMFLKGRSSPEAAFFASLCFFTFPNTFQQSTVGEIDMFLAMTLFLAILLWVRIYSVKLFRIRDALWFTFCLMIANLVKWPTFSIILSASLLMTMFLEQKTATVRILVLSTAIAILPVLIWCVHNYRPGDSSLFFYLMTKLGSPISLRAYVGHKWQLLGEILEDFSPWIFIAPIFILMNVFGKKRIRENSLFLMFVIYVLVSVLIVLVSPNTRPYYLTPVSPVLAIMMGYLYFDFKEKGSRRFLSALRLLVLCLVSYGIFYNINFIATAKEKHSYNQKNAQIIDQYVKDNIIYLPDVYFMNQVIYLKSRYKFISLKPDFFVGKDRLFMIRERDYVQLLSQPFVRKDKLLTVASLDYGNAGKAFLIRTV